MLEKNNYHKQQLSNVSVFQNFWFDAIDHYDHKFDLIVSNPCYININESHHSQGDVRFEIYSIVVYSANGLDNIKNYR